MFSSWCVPPISFCSRRFKPGRASANKAFPHCSTLAMAPPLIGSDDSTASSNHHYPQQSQHHHSSQQDNICPGARRRYFNESQIPALRQLYHDADRYHNLGGSLLALQEYLDSLIDHTHEVLGLSFVMDQDSSSPHTQGKAHDIVQELRRRDTDNRGGYFQRSLPGNFKGIHPRHGRSTGMEVRFVDIVESRTLTRWHVAMGPHLEQDSCRGFSILPGPPRKRYEDKYMCGWDQLVLHSDESDNDNKNEDSPPHQEEECNIISIGSNDEWGFETNIVRASQHCRIATFDCTIQNPKRKPSTDQVQFHSLCISDKKETVNGRAFDTYAALVQAANFSSSHVNYLKMDIEGYEYNVLTSMIRQAKESNQLHLLPEQLQLEFHYSTWMYDLPWTLRSRQAGELTLFFGMLFREAGYVAVHIEQKEQVPSLTEVLLLRVFC